MYVFQAGDFLVAKWMYAVVGSTNTMCRGFVCAATLGSTLN